MNNNLQKKIFSLLLLQLLMLSVSFSQNYNDGRIRLRVWINKVWSNSNCGEIGNQEYRFKGIRARIPDGSGGFSYSTSYNIAYSGDNNRYYDASQFSPTPAATNDGVATGYRIIDNTYTTTLAPNQFEVIMSEAFEEDCESSGILDCWQGTYNVYDQCCCLFGICASSDEYLGSGTWTSVLFRGGAPGQVNYTQPFVINPVDEHSYTVVFAYQWDWVDPLPPTCPSPKYADGPITLSVEFDDVFCDSDWDGGSCGISTLGDEDLRLKFRTKDNITGAFPAWPAPAIHISQNKPKWNNAPNSTIFSRSYTLADQNMETVNIEYDLWEEDGFETTIFGYLFRPCGDANWDNNYNSNCCITIAGINFCWNGDDIRATGTYNLNWRSSPPNTDNYVEIPVRLSGTQYSNWIVRLKYKWTINNPTVTMPDVDYVRCTGTGLTLTPTATANATYYQWQVADVTTTGGTICPATANWTDISGANCATYTVPPTPGTRIYRLMVLNRNGNGSKTNTGDRYAVAYSGCQRVTYLPYAPPIVSTACGGSVPSGSYTFSATSSPDINAIGGNVTYTWSVFPATGVTFPSGNTGASVNISFPATPQTYTVTLTVSGGGCASTTSVCTVKVVGTTCNFINVSTAGNDVTGDGSITAPFASLQKALNTISGENNHIRFLSGNYAAATSKITIPASASGVNAIVDGGYEVDPSGDWRKVTNAKSIFHINSTLETAAYDGASGTTVGHFIGLEMIGRTNITFEDLEFYVKNGTNNGINSGTAVGSTPTGNRGNSVYGIYMRNSTGIKFNRVNVFTGQAGAGTNGAAGTNGVKGENGNNGANGDCDDDNTGNYGGNGGRGAGGGSSTGGGAAGGGGQSSSGSPDGGNSGGVGSTSNNSRHGGGGGGGAGGAGEARNGQPGGNGGRGGNNDGGAGGSGYGGGGGSAGSGTNCNRDGRKGANGNAGVAGTDAGAAPANANNYNWYILPNGKSADGVSDGYGGGGAQGGGAGAGQGGTLVIDGTGSNGGGGGGGGEGGTKGFGGWGGGSSIALYAYGGSYTKETIALNPGTVGAGGLKGDGGGGGAGGTGGCGGGGNNTSLTAGNVLGGGVDGTSGCGTSRVCNNCEVGAGGQGGRGGAGGKGGDGQPGAPGASEAERTVNNPTVTTSTVVYNTANILKANYRRGCTNSQVLLSKSGGNPFDLANMGNAVVINDVTPILPSVANAAGTINDLKVNFPSLGTYSIKLTAATAWTDFIRIRDLRDKPEIFVTPEINGITRICSGETVNLQSISNNPNASGTQYEWVVQRLYPGSITGVNTPAATATYTVKDPGNVNVFTNATTDSIVYQIRYRTFDKCCGWSVSIYDSVIVYPAMTPPSVPVKIPNQATVCTGGTLTIAPSSGGGGGATTATGQSCGYIYNYSTDNGGLWSGWSNTLPVITAVEGTTIIKVAYRCTMAGANCDTLFAPSDAVWTVYEQPTASASIDDIQLCQATPTAILTAATPSIGTGVWTQISGASSSPQIPPGTAQTITVVNIPWGSNNNTYRWTVTNGTCSDFVNLTITSSITQDLSTISMDTLGCYTCAVVDGNTYYYLDRYGKLILKLTDLNSTTTTPNSPSYSSASLGLTEVCLRIPTPNISPTPRVITNKYADMMPYLDRYWTIKPADNNLHAMVTLYFTQPEYIALMTAATGTPYAFNSIADLRVSKWPGGGNKIFDGPDNILIQNNRPGGIMLPGGQGYYGGNATWTYPNFSTYLGSYYQVSFIIDSFSTFYIHPVRFQYEVLPVELVSFTGTNEGDKNRLDWLTASEKNTDKFIVEKSLDGINWFYIGEQKAAGNSNVPLSYKLYDYAPVLGDNYYRLKIVDTDESFKYSDIIKIKLNDIAMSNDIVTIYPNPAVKTLNIVLSAASDEKVNIGIVNVLGQEITNRDYNLKTGINTIELNVSDLAKATYMINVAFGEQKKVYTKFVKD
jgi:hypothetical protein